MNIALFGYGKMGKLIEEISVNRGHQIVAIKDIDSVDVDFSKADVGIDFSTPEAAFENIDACLSMGIPVISGTTGWLDRYEEISDLCKKQNGAFLYASNFSLGVNIFFALNSFLARLMKPLDDYKVDIEETHHIHKLDAPSGTAISLARDIIENSSLKEWELDGEGEGIIPIHSFRSGEVPGTHVVRYSSSIDDIEIRHTAHSRKGFALGAVIAAEWIVGKSGVFTMEDVLNIG